MTKPKQAQVTWADVYSTSKYIADNVVKPDLIIGIASGGIIPTAIIARRLNVFNVQHIGIKSYTEQKTQESIQLYYKPNLSNITADKKILIVDDLLDSGSSFKYVCNYLMDNGIRSTNIQCAALYYKIKDSDQFIPNNFVQGTNCPGDVWLVYPWE